MSALYPSVVDDDDFGLHEKPPTSLGGPANNYVVHIPDEPARRATVNVVEEETFSPARSCCCATKVCLAGWALTFLVVAILLAVMGTALTYGLGAAVYDFEPNVNTFNVAVPWKKQHTTESVSLKPFDVVYYALDTAVLKPDDYTNSNTTTLKLCFDSSKAAVSAYAQVGYPPVLDDSDYYYDSSQMTLSDFYSPPETFKEAIEVPPCHLVSFSEDEGINICTDDAIVYVTVVAEFNDDGDNAPADVDLTMYYDYCMEECACYYRIALATVFGLIVALFAVLIVLSCCIACICCTCCCVVHFGSGTS
eukprot:CAMPEP_0114628360 /NCGR_PEP_ID=MMETSP0168-20121206/12781_1 /TAXON_ID=95228 ORGANISM="Vannella sp., Strain DIVA3 517/6/12" /NCGR_SAMPLE_ID=MMETSP0168 /ASSEMBLY_ACC=CAM_ASM_000044 /LENGTH=306 /DNA_ID=CAMNT_0001839741 /DNA_START=12 /DNA_END=929 /DNA_ORIENTATION=-